MKKLMIVITLLFTSSTIILSFRRQPISPHSYNVSKDSIASVNAFKQVYRVLMSPRCMNCHPSGDIPLQGDDSHLHTMSPKRGIDGKGVYAMKCSNCHQPANTPGLHTPPGNPNWHLPPADMKMVFQGKTPRQLAKQLIDPKLNGHKDMQKLIEHADDGLVLSAWNPGEGRTLPPMSHAAFKKAWLTWLRTGAYAPAR
jgi:mono/diheme cytochrome c family protein